jgi:hypothetical protein
MADEGKGVCPPWIDDFTEVVGDCFETGLVPIAYDVWGPDDPGGPEDLADPWEVHFYPSLSEMVGGPRDGAIVYPGMTVDLIGVQDAFDDLETLSWGSRSRRHEPRYDGSVLDAIGWYCGHPMWLRVFDVPPDDGTIDTLLEHSSGRLRPKENA